MEKVSVFIDGNNFYFGLKKIYGNDAKLMDFSFEKFVNFIAGDREVIKVYYYNAPLDRTKNMDIYKKQQRFFEKLRKIPKFEVILCKLLKRRIAGTDKYYYVLKEDDIHMAGDMIKGAYEDEYDCAILVSGDGDFLPAVKIVRNRNKRVENVYFRKSASTNLRKNCDKSILLKKDILDGFFEFN